MGHLGGNDRVDDPECPPRYLPSVLAAPETTRGAGLWTLIQEAYVDGLSRRKVHNLVKLLGLKEASKSEVTRLNGELDLAVEAFRIKPLTDKHPYV